MESARLCLSSSTVLGNGAMNPGTSVYGDRQTEKSVLSIILEALAEPPHDEPKLEFLDRSIRG